MCSMNDPLLIHINSVLESAAHHRTHSIVIVEDENGCNHRTVSNPAQMKTNRHTSDSRCAAAMTAQWNRRVNKFQIDDENGSDGRLICTLSIAPHSLVGRPNEIFYNFSKTFFSIGVKIGGSLHQKISNCQERFVILSFCDL